MDKTGEENQIRVRRNSASGRATLVSKIPRRVDSFRGYGIEIQNSIMHLPRCEKEEK